LRGGPDSCAIRVAKQQAEPITWVLLIMLAACRSSPGAEAVFFQPPAPHGAPIAQLSGPPGRRGIVVPHLGAVPLSTNAPKARQGLAMTDSIAASCKSPSPPFPRDPRGFHFSCNSWFPKNILVAAMPCCYHAYGRTGKASPLQFPFDSGGGFC
jgi:hypothetical protein